MDKVEAGMRHPSIGNLYLPKEEHCTGPHARFSPTECLLVTGWVGATQVFLVYNPLSAGEFNHWSITADSLLTYYRLAVRAQQQTKKECTPPGEGGIMHSGRGMDTPPETR